jgi:hypothetical protein
MTPRALLLRLLPLALSACSPEVPFPFEACYTPGARFPKETPALPCLPAEDPRLRGYLVQASGLTPDKIVSGPTERADDAGEPRCCYQAQQAPSGAGRPLTVLGFARLAPLQHDSSWPC